MRMPGTCLSRRTRTCLGLYRLGRHVYHIVTLRADVLAFRQLKLIECDLFLTLNRQELIGCECIVEHVSQLLHLLTLALDVSFLELLREVIVQVFLHVELLDDLGPHDCLSYAV